MYFNTDVNIIAKKDYDEKDFRLEQQQLKALKSPNQNSSGLWMLSL